MNGADEGGLPARLGARLSWRAPTDRGAAERAVREVYRAAGLRDPDTILWVAGPREARDVLSGLGWFGRLPVLALAFALAGAAADTAVRIQQDVADAAGAPWAGAPWIPVPWMPVWNIGLAIVAAVLFVALLNAETVRRADTVAVHAGLAAGVAAAAAAHAVLPDRLRWSAAVLLLGALAGPAVAVMIARARDGVPRPPRRAGGPAARAVLRLFRRAGLGRVRAAMPRTPALTVRARGPAWSGVLELLAPGGVYPPDALLVWPPRPSSGAASDTAAEAVTALLLHVDALWPFRRVAVALLPPAEVHVDENGRLHNASGAAVRWRDGSELFACAGQLPTDLRLALHPGRLSLRQVVAEADPGVRRVLLERFGPQRVMDALGGRRVAGDDTGELWRAPEFDGEALTMVRVLNATPEPDGSRRVYWLRVPPYITSARQGVAWTFGLDPLTYRPRLET
ncbi:DUF6745 domain-containing protein [Azospirillum sp. ST 5-10]|uniref:DUF6745 domain-containing protein n=1 Tax=unclassified Azospirillum TaxID=2630922 RepID=UPI003F4A5021